MGLRVLLGPCRYEVALGLSSAAEPHARASVTPSIAGGSVELGRISRLSGIALRSDPPKARVLRLRTPPRPRGVFRLLTPSNVRREPRPRAVAMRHRTEVRSLTNCSRVVRHGLASPGISACSCVHRNSRACHELARSGTGMTELRHPVRGEWGCRGRRFKSSRPDHH